MVLAIGSYYRVRTLPFNWVLEELKEEGGSWELEGYYETLDAVIERLSQKGVKRKLLKRIQEKVFVILNINEAQTSALFLTRGRHPHFRKKMNPKSVANLKKNRKKFVSTVLMQLGPEVDKCSKKY